MDAWIQLRHPRGAASVATDQVNAVREGDRLLDQTGGQMNLGTRPERIFEGELEAAAGVRPVAAGPIAASPGQDVDIRELRAKLPNPFPRSLRGNLNQRLDLRACFGGGRAAGIFAEESLEAPEVIGGDGCFPFQFGYPPYRWSRAAAAGIGPITALSSWAYFLPTGQKKPLARNQCPPTSTARNTESIVSSNFFSSPPA
jgi:hypothetical protein